MKNLLLMGLFALCLFATALASPTDTSTDSPPMEELFTTKAWALEANFFNRIVPVALERIRLGHDLSVLGNKEAKEMVLISEYDDYSGLPLYSATNGGKVAHIPVVGTMTKRGSLSAYGSQSIGKFIEKANASPKVNSILMVFDGPGGAVDGTPELGYAIANSKKPIIGFVDGMAASAHYWTASQTAYLVGNSQNYTEVGSIGVLTMLVSQQEWLVKQGLKVEIMRAEQSVDKALLNSIEEWPDAAKAELQLQLNEIAADFKATVIAGRGSRLSTGEEDIFTGKMYSLEKAIELGMVDYAMTLAEAVDFAAEVGASRAATT